MSIFPIQCVALDFDLTLFDYANPSDLNLIVPWLTVLAEHGIKVGIASGRSRESLSFEIEKSLLRWGSPFPAFIVEYECLVRTSDGDSFPGTESWNELILNETARLTAEAVPLLESVRSQANRDGVEIVRDILIEPGNANLVLATPADAERARRTLASQLEADFPHLEVRRNHHILILTLAGRNKGASLRQLQTALNLKAEEILVVGDNLNDLSMMNPQLGFQCATVGNADPVVTEFVRERGGFVAEAGITRGVMQIFAQTFPDLVSPTEFASL